MALANVYALALFQAANDQNIKGQALDELEKSWTALEEILLASNDLRDCLFSPITSSVEKENLIQELATKLNIHPLLFNFLKTLNRKRRLSSLIEIKSKFRVLRLQAEGIVLGEVTSVDPLQQSDLNDLGASFTKKLGRKVELTNKIDASLLGGIKVTIDGTTYDGSVRSQLDKLKNALLN